MKRALALLPIFAALAGCAAAARPVPDAALTAPSDASRLARLTRLGEEIAGSVSPPGAVAFALSSRGGLGAWSWPDGRVRVSRDLVDLLDEDELRAALAHELGHLVDGGHVAGGPAALAGSRDAAGSEARADVLGCRLLRARDAAPEALPRMLRRVAGRLDAGAEGPDPALLLRRAAAADASCAAP